MCLFAVTTRLPVASAAATSVRAGSSPPIDLDDDVDVGARDEVRRRVGQQRLRDAGGDRPLGHVPDRDAGEDERRAVGRREARRPLEQRAHDLAADGARADHADAQGLEAHGTGS